MLTFSFGYFICTWLGKMITLGEAGEGYALYLQHFYKPKLISKLKRLKIKVKFLQQSTRPCMTCSYSLIVSLDHLFFPFDLTASFTFPPVPTPGPLHCQSLFLDHSCLSYLHGSILPVKFWLKCHPLK